MIRRGTTTAAKATHVSHLSVFHDGGKSTEIPVESQSRRSGDRM